jgi:hypothetical protein
LDLGKFERAGLRIGSEIMEKEVDIRIFIQDDGNLRITGYAGSTVAGLWHGASISDVEWDNLVLGNAKFVRELKKLLKNYS